jgi:hypothetical protein
MGKGQVGMNGSDRGFSQVERDLRDLKRSGEYHSRKSAPVTLEEQIAHNKFSETFEGKYPNYGAWEFDLIEELRRIRCGYTILSEYGIYPRTFKDDGYVKQILPREYAKILKDRTGL